MEILFFLTLSYFFNLSYGQSVSDSDFSAKQVYLDITDPKPLTSEQVKEEILKKYSSIIKLLKEKDVLYEEAKISGVEVEVSDDLSSVDDNLRDISTHLVELYFFTTSIRSNKKTKSVCQFRAPFNGVNFYKQLSREVLDSFLSCELIPD